MTVFQHMATLLKIIILWLAIPLLAGCERQAPERQIVVPQGDRVSIPLAAVNDGGVHFFTFKHGGKNINFFVRTDGAGKLQANTW